MILPPPLPVIGALEYNGLYDEMMMTIGLKQEIC